MQSFSNDSLRLGKLNTESITEVKIMNFSMLTQVKHRWTYIHTSTAKHRTG